MLLLKNPTRKCKFTQIILSKRNRELKLAEFNKRIKMATERNSNMLNDVNNRIKAAQEAESNRLKEEGKRFL